MTAISKTLIRNSDQRHQNNHKKSQIKKNAKIKTPNTTKWKNWDNQKQNKNIIMKSTKSYYKQQEQKKCKTKFRNFK